MLIPANFKTRTALDNFSLRYANAESDFVATKILPIAPVPKAAFKFYLYSKSNSRIQKTHAPDGSEAPKGDYDVRTANGTCEQHAWKGIVLSRDAREFDRPVADIRQDTVANNMDVLMLGLEQEVVDLVLDVNNYAAANKVTLASTWASGNGDPVEDIRAGRDAVKASALARPNALALNQRSLDYLKNHPAIVDRVKYVGTTTEQAMRAAISALLEVELIVADAYKVTSNEGAADTTAAIWGSQALLFYKNPQAGLRLREKSFGKLFMVNQITTKSMQRDELARAPETAEEVETAWEYKPLLTMQDSNGDSDAGYLISGTY